MPQTQCCVPGCLNRGGHMIPKDVSVRKKWLNVIRRQETSVEKSNNTWEPKSRSTFVCSRHFKEDDYINVTVHGCSPLSHRLKKGAVPSRFPWTSLPSPQDQKRREGVNNEEKKQQESTRTGCSNLRSVTEQQTKMDLNKQENKTAVDGERHCSEIAMARELFSAASETIKMAKHIRRLESKINKLEKKIKIDTSSSSDSDQDAGSSDKEGATSRNKHTKKRLATSDHESGTESTGKKRKRKPQYQDNQVKGEKLNDVSVCDETAVEDVTSEEMPTQQIKQYTREVIQVKAPLVTVTPIEKLDEHVKESEQINSTSTGESKPQSKQEQYVQEKGKAYQYQCSYCQVYVRQLPNTLKGEHLIKCATKHLRPPPTPAQINTLIQKNKLNEVMNTAGKSSSSLEVLEKKDSPAFPIEETSQQRIAKESTEQVVETMTENMERNPKDHNTTAIKKANVKRSTPKLVSSTSITWKVKKELDFTCEDCGLLLAKAARLSHSQVCRKVMTCLYCSKVFGNLDLLTKHKPQCKEVNWDQHPVRLLQHGQDIPYSVFSVSSSPTKAAGKDKSEKASNLIYEESSTRNRELEETSETSVLYNTCEEQGSKVKTSDKPAKLVEDEVGKVAAQWEPKIQRRNRSKMKVENVAITEGRNHNSDAVKIESADQRSKEKEEKGEQASSPVRHICTKCEKEFTARRFLITHQMKCRKRLNNKQSESTSRIEMSSMKPDNSGAEEQSSGKDAERIISNTKKPLVFHLCMECDHQFVSAKELRDHHKNPTECKEWIELKNRNKGLKTATRFCFCCHKNFPTHHDFIEHRKICVDSKLKISTYNCFRCYMAFPDKDALNQHRKLAHSINRSSNCWVCGATFSNFKEFLKHAEEHGDIKKTHPSRSRPCHVRDGHHLVLKKGEDPTDLAPLPPGAMDAILNVMKDGNNTGDLAPKAKNVMVALPMVTQSQDQQSVDRKGTKSKGKSGVMKTQDGHSLKGKQPSISGTCDTLNPVETQAIETRTENQFKSNQDIETTKVEQSGCSSSSFANPSNTPSSSKQSVSVVQLQQSVALNETQTVNKVTELLHSLKSAQPTGEAFPKLLKTHGINEPLQMRTNDPQVQKIISSLKSSQQIKLTGNRVGYILKVCKTGSGYQLMDPTTPAADKANKAISTDASENHKSTETSVEPSETKSETNGNNNETGILTNLLRSPQESLITKRKRRRTPKRTRVVAHEEGLMHREGREGQVSKKSKPQPVSQEVSNAIRKAAQIVLKQQNLKNQSEREDRKGDAAETLDQLQGNFSSEIAEAQLKTIIQATSVKQTSYREVVQNNPKSMELAAQIMASGGSNQVGSFINKKAEMVETRPKLEPSILTRKERLGKKRVTRSTVGKNTGGLKVSSQSPQSVQCYESPIQTIVPIGDNKVKCMHCNTVMTNISEITSHKCSTEDEECSRGDASAVDIMKECSRKDASPNTGREVEAQGASLEQFSKLGILGTVQMIRNEESPCEEDNIDVEGDEEADDREWVMEVLSE